jgi:hypothetical protein
MNNKFDELTKQMAQSVTRREALKKFEVDFAGMVLACFGLVGCAIAAQPFSTIDYPGAVFTTSAGINRFGDVVGHYIDASGMEHGYLLHKGTYSAVDFPGSDGGHVHDINSSGTILSWIDPGKSCSI